MKLLFLSALILLLSACATSPPSPQITAAPENEITLAEVVETPILFEQSTVRWGGRVLKAELISDHGTTLLRVEIVDYPLDTRGKPLTESSPGLRFVAHIEQGDQSLADLLDKVFKRNAFVTVVGNLHGSEGIALANGQAQELPVVNVEDFYRWSYSPKESRRNHGVSFGIGIGIKL